MQDPYDELPYRASPIEWSAPERLALTSLLHGGPRIDPGAPYRVLELGCADGSNLLPLAWFRRHASFVGLDGARTQVELATARAAALGLRNLAFVHASFEDAEARLEGQFDFIIVHGVFSWIPLAVRDALLELCARRLRTGGLLYLNYNAKPGWNVRGMVRDFVIAQTAGAGITGLRARAEAARDVCRRLVDAMDGEEHGYRRLMLGELRLVRDGDLSYVAHEYLAPENHAYWRSELDALLGQHGLAYVADADFDQPWARMDDTFVGWLRGEGIVGRTIEDTVDLLLYRQLCSPIFTPAPLVRREPDAAEIGRLVVASPLAPTSDTDVLPVVFDHPSGAEVTVGDPEVRDAFVRLGPVWPQGLRVDQAFGRVAAMIDDLRMLQRNGLVALRLWEPPEPGPEVEALHRLEVEHGGYRTNAYHVREAIAPEPAASDED